MPSPCYSPSVNDDSGGFGGHDGGYQFSSRGRGVLSPPSSLARLASSLNTNFMDGMFDIYRGLVLFVCAIVGK